MDDSWLYGWGISASRFLLEEKFGIRGFRLVHSKAV